LNIQKIKTLKAKDIQNPIVNKTNIVNDQNQGINSRLGITDN
jgi:hypothetical protein